MATVAIQKQENSFQQNFCTLGLTNSGRGNKEKSCAVHLLPLSIPRDQSTTGFTLIKFNPFKEVKLLICVLSLLYTNPLQNVLIFVSAVFFPFLGQRAAISEKDSSVFSPAPVSFPTPTRSKLIAASQCTEDIC